MEVSTDAMAHAGPKAILLLVSVKRRIARSLLERHTNEANADFRPG